MKKKSGKRLVIDASVARSVGMTEHPVSAACRSALEKIRSSQFRVVMSPDLRDEWKTHRSVYARRWLALMYGRRQVAVLGDAREPDFRAALESCAGNLDCPGDERDAQATAMEKDAHLIEAACASDHTVISLDEKVRHHFIGCTDRISKLRGIVWVNPTKETEYCSQWIEAGAPADADRMLGSRKSQ